MRDEKRLDSIQRSLRSELTMVEATRVIEPEIGPDLYITTFCAVNSWKTG